ncbi:phage baseplate protein, partial [Escherichia coli]|nr:phage baseplate protein [Escherichia coli]
TINGKSFIEHIHKDGNNENTSPPV